MPAEQTLTEKLKEDKDALDHQRYLIDGVIKNFSTKKLNYFSANKSLIKNNTEKWLKKRDPAASDSAIIGTKKGYNFGSPSKLPVKPIQVG